MKVIVRLFDVINSFLKPFKEDEMCVKTLARLIERFR